MTEGTWTPYDTAEALVKFLPLLGRLIGGRIRDTSEDEGTLIQLLALTQFKEKPLTASELAKRRRVSLQSASTLVQRLYERGWIVREPDPNDRRQTLLKLTPEGLAYAQATLDQMVSFLAEYLEPLTTDELEAAQVLFPALQRVMQITPDETLER